LLILVIPAQAAPMQSGQARPASQGLTSQRSLRLWVPAFEFVNFSPPEVSVVGIKFSGAPPGWPPRLLAGGFISGLVPFCALVRDGESGIRAASTSQRGPTQQVVGNGQEQGYAGDLGHTTYGEALHSVLHSELGIDTFRRRCPVPVDGLTFFGLHALPPGDHPRLGAWLRRRLLASLFSWVGRIPAPHVPPRPRYPSSLQIPRPADKPQGAALPAGPPAPPSPIPPPDRCLD